MKNFVDVSEPPFNAMLDGVTPADVAFDEAEDAIAQSTGGHGAGTIAVPGPVLLTRGRKPLTPVNYLGYGRGGVAGVNGHPAAAYGSRLIFNSGGVAINFEGLVGGGLSNLLVEAPNANCAVVVNSCFRVAIEHCGLHGGLSDTLTYIAADNATSSWHNLDFNMIWADTSGRSLIYLEGVPGSGNPCLLSARGNMLSHVGNRKGIVHAGDDNSTWDTTYIYAPPGTTGESIGFDLTKYPTQSSEILYRDVIPVNGVLIPAQNVNDPTDGNRPLVRFENYGAGNAPLPICNLRPTYIRTKDGWLIDWRTGQRSTRDY